MVMVTMKGLTGSKDHGKSSFDPIGLVISLSESDAETSSVKSERSNESLVTSSSSRVSPSSSDVITRKELARTYRALRKIEVKDRKHHFDTYYKCFVGKEAVDLILSCNCAVSREDAVRRCRAIAAEWGVIESVTGNHLFKDSNSFYRFIRRPTGPISELSLPKLEAENDGTSKAIDAFVNGNGELDFRTMQRLLKAFQRIETKDGQKKSVTHQQCFVGKEAVSALLSSGCARSRLEAIQIGRKLSADYRLFDAVKRNHDFDDDDFLYRFKHDFENRVIQRLAKVLRRVEVKDRKYHLKTYRQCFVGTEAVDLLISSGCATSRVDAVLIGRALQRESNLFEHVCGDHDFKDGYFFFRFRESYH